jgi:subtilase family serine protease
VRPVTIPALTSPGHYDLLARADDADAIVEADETNNVGATIRRLLVGADVTVASATAPPGIAPGTNASVSHTLRNLGAAATGPFGVAFFLVPVDAGGTPTGADVALPGGRSGVTLGPGVTAPVVVTPVPVPGDTPPGTYRIRVVADPGGAVTEADEGNNALLTGVVRVAQPDLTVPSVTFTPAAVAAGANVSVSHVVRNLAPAPGGAPASGSAIHLSVNRSAQGALAGLGAVTVPALGGGGSATVLRSLRVPAGTAPGRYFVLAAGDAGAAIAETREDNNLGASLGTLLVGPDIALTALGSAPAAALRGGNVTVTRTLRNLGAAPAGPFDLGLVLVPVDAGGAPSGPEIPLPAGGVGLVLNPGATLTGPVTIALPGSVTAGRYRVRATADPGGVVAEADEGNNALVGPVLNVVQADLAASPVTFVPASAAAGGTLTVTQTVRNVALAPAGAPPTTARLYLSVNQSVAGAVAPLGTLAVPALAAGGAATLTRPVTIPPLTGPGRYFIVGRADDGDVLAEAGEDNNVGASATTLVIGTDLVVTAASAPDSVLAGGGLRVTYSVQNQGTASVGPFTVALLLRPVFLGVLFGQPFPLESRVVPSLAPGAALSVTTTVPVPATAAPSVPGATYRILVFADSLEQVAEVEETNNLRNTADVTVIGQTLH